MRLKKIGLGASQHGAAKYILLFEASKMPSGRLRAAVLFLRQYFLL
jgi:hypothetical protein